MVECVISERLLMGSSVRRKRQPAMCKSYKPRTNTATYPYMSSAGWRGMTVSIAVRVIGHVTNMFELKELTQRHPRQFLRLVSGHAESSVCFHFPQVVWYELHLLLVAA